MSISFYEPRLGNREEEKVAEVLQEGWISQSGSATKAFESEVKDFLNAEFGVATDSGTAALHTALQALNISQGDRVAVPGMTFGATAMAVKQVGAEPVPVDIDIDTLGMDPSKLEEKFSSGLDAVIVVHLLGIPAKIEEIKRIADRHEIPVIEDVAQAFGSSLDSYKLGLIGDIGVYSFSWNKTITTAKGGFVTTRRKDLEGDIKQIVCNAAVNGEKFEEEIGYNYRMDSLRAALGAAQMKDIGNILRKKKDLVNRYIEGCRQIEGVEFTSKIGAENVSPWTFYILTDNREKLAAHLNDRNIGYRRFYPPLPELGSFKDSYKLSTSRSISKRGLMLPTHPSLCVEDIDEIINTLDRCKMIGAEKTY